MKRMLLGVVVALLLPATADARDDAAELSKATGLRVLPALTIHRALSVLPACAKRDGIPYKAAAVRRASDTVIHLGVDGATLWNGRPVILSTTITVKLRHGHLRAWNRLFGAY